MTASRIDSRPYREFALWTFAIVCGALYTWINRYGVSADGISYLDVGDAYFRGDWRSAISAAWSPLYSWLVGGALFLLRPSPSQELSVAHLVNFIVYLAALGSFHFFLSELIRGRTAQRSGTTHDASRVPEWAFWIVGYLLFVWSSFVLIPASYLVPDMCVAALVYLAAGLLQRMRADGRPQLAALLGVTLGFGYLSKSSLFPLAFVFLAVSVLLARRYRRVWRHVLLALGCFALVSAPFVLAITLSKGRLTFGDSGKLNYAWSLNDVPPRHWQGGGDHGVPVHPTRRVFDTPAIYEFGTPLIGTYPVWYDPSYWYEGVTLTFDLRKQWLVIVDSLQFYQSLFSFRGVLLPLGVAVLFVISGDKRRFVKAFWGQWFLLAPACAAFAMYSLVHVEARYVAPFAVMILMGAMAGIELPTSPTARRAAILVVCGSIGLSMGMPLVRSVRDAARTFVEGTTRNDYWPTAEALTALGMRPGDKVASLGYANPFNARWARLARVRIVAEMFDAKDVDYFWTADEQVRQKAVRVFADTGAVMIVAPRAPASATASGWQRVQGSNAYVYFLGTRQ